MNSAPNAYSGHQSQVGIRTRPWGLVSRMSRLSLVMLAEIENREQVWRGQGHHGAQQVAQCLHHLEPGRKGQDMSTYVKVSEVLHPRKFEGKMKRRERRRIVGEGNWEGQ